MSLVIVGSLAFDTIETPLDRREKIVGGSGTYCSLAASFFTHPRVVGVVGRDFPRKTLDFLKSRKIDLKGVSIKAGKTFHWEGRYGEDPNQRTTVRTDLNVFADFKPVLPPSYRSADIVYLANIDPDLH
ncbi:MAG: carbohydrate kinase family protein, partial [Candidatus Aminicenantales bacterium]